MNGIWLGRAWPGRTARGQPGQDFQRVSLNEPEWVPGLALNIHPYDSAESGFVIAHPGPSLA